MFNKKPRRVRREFFQYKCDESQKIFLEETNSTTKLSSCFKKTDKFRNNANLFFKTLNKTIHKCFKKVRIKTGSERPLGDQNIQAKLKLKLDLKKLCKNSTCEKEKKEALDKLEEIEEVLVEEFASKNAATVKEHLESLVTVWYYTYI